MRRRVDSTANTYGEAIVCCIACDFGCIERWRIRDVDLHGLENHLEFLEVKKNPPVYTYNLTQS